MYIVDDICYAGRLTDGVRVIQVKPIKDRIMLLTFSTGEKRLLDTSLLEGAAFDVLNNEKVFNNPKLFHGVITWDEGKVDIAPETAYAKSQPL